MEIVRIILAYILAGMAAFLFISMGTTVIELLRAKTVEINERRILRQSKKIFIELRIKHKDDRDLVGTFTALIKLIESSEKK